MKIGDDAFFTYSGVSGRTEYLKLNKTGDQIRKIVKNELLPHPSLSQAVLSRNDSIFIVSIIGFENDSMEYAYTILDNVGNELLRNNYKFTFFSDYLRLSFSGSNQLLIYSVRVSVEMGIESIWQRIKLDGTIVSEFNHFMPGRKGDDHFVESTISEDIDGNNLFISVPSREYLVIYGIDY